MKTIYSILYVTLNTALNEKVSIGLLMSDGKYDRFRFSADKLLALKGIIEPERYNLVKGYLKSLESDINVAGDEKVVFENKALKNNWVNEGYISYLSRYSNNLIQFSEPKTIDILFSPENYKRIYEKYIYAFDQKIEEVFVESIFTKVKQELYPKITNRVNLDFALDSSHFENLFAPIEVNFIGINGMPVAGQTIDFDKKHHFLENDIARFVSLTKAIELEGKEKGKYFVLGHEPDKKDDKNHLLWEQIKDSKFLEFVDVNDVDRVEEYIEKHEVKPYFAE